MSPLSEELKAFLCDCAIHKGCVGLPLDWEPLCLSLRYLLRAEWHTCDASECDVSARQRGHWLLLSAPHTAESQAFLDGIQTQLLDSCDHHSIAEIVEDLITLPLHRLPLLNERLWTAAVESETAEALVRLSLRLGVDDWRRYLRSTLTTSPHRLEKILQLVLKVRPHHRIRLVFAVLYVLCQPIHWCVKSDSEAACAGPITMIQRFFDLAQRDGLWTGLDPHEEQWLGDPSVGVLSQPILTLIFMLYGSEDLQHRTASWAAELWAGTVSPVANIEMSIAVALAMYFKLPVPKSAITPDQVGHTFPQRYSPPQAPLAHRPSSSDVTRSQVESGLGLRSASYMPLPRYVSAPVAESYFAWRMWQLRPLKKAESVPETVLGDFWTSEIGKGIQSPIEPLRWVEWDKQSRLLVFFFASLCGIIRLSVEEIPLSGKTTDELETLHFTTPDQLSYCRGSERPEPVSEASSSGETRSENLIPAAQRECDEVQPTQEEEIVCIGFTKEQTGGRTISSTGPTSDDLFFEEAERRDNDPQSKPNLSETIREAYRKATEPLYPSTSLWHCVERLRSRVKAGEINTLGASLELTGHLQTPGLRIKMDDPATRWTVATVISEEMPAKLETLLIDRLTPLVKSREQAALFRSAIVQLETVSTDAFKAVCEPIGGVPQHLRVHIEECLSLLWLVNLTGTALADDQTKPL